MSHEQTRFKSVVLDSWGPRLEHPQQSGSTMDLDVLDVIPHEKHCLVDFAFSGFGGFTKIGKQETFYWHSQHYQNHYRHY